MPDTLGLALNHGEFRQEQLFRIRRDDIVRFSPGSSLLGKKVILYTNYPVDKTEFVRAKFRQLQWLSRDGVPIKCHADGRTEVNDLDMYCEIVAQKAGSFKFYTSYAANGPEESSVQILIEPKLFFGPPKARQYVPLDAVRCQTVLAKCLGPMPTWRKKLQVAKEAAYNMIHFTPIHELGGSRSCYSLADQLQVNPEFGKGVTFNDLEKEIKFLREEWTIGSICDIVLNHTANESKWLKEHPESTYSCFTCPHLRPAFLLDALLLQIGLDVAAGDLEVHGVPKVIDREEHLQALRAQIFHKYLPQINLHEFFQCNVDQCVAEFTEELKKTGPPSEDLRHVGHEEHNFRVPERFIIEYDPGYGRLSAGVNVELAVQLYNLHHERCENEAVRVAKCATQFKRALQELNLAIKREIDGDLGYAIENCLAGTRYERVEDGGPKYREIAVKYPLFQNYFTKTGAEGKTIKEIESMMYDNRGKFFMAHNGWVMNSDPLKDFAAPLPGDRNVYFRRELIAWGDSVKLRYGDKPADSPYLWKHMQAYVDQTAKIFDGVRLDNCHSTPLHVAEYLLDSARKINPELYVVAELFTNSDGTDNIFVNRLGINSLIREAMAAWDAHEQGRLVYRYGGIPVGAFFSSPKRPIAPNIAHALFLDLTHDNKSPVLERSVFDLLPSASLVSMACCATGSNRGYDELVPHHIHVVDEERQYQEWGTDRHVTQKTGMVVARRALNLLHGDMASQGFNEVYVDQMHPDIVAVTRYSSKTHQTVVLVAHMSFFNPLPYAGPTGVRPLRFEGDLEEIIVEAITTRKGTGPQFEPPGAFVKDPNYINGLEEYEIVTREHIPLSESVIFDDVPHITDTHTELFFKDLKPGCVVAIRAKIKQYARGPLEKLLKVIDDFHYEKGVYQDLKGVVKNLDLVDLNQALFLCNDEEQQLIGSGAYGFQNVGAQVYCGFQGIISFLSEISPKHDLGHPVCNNLREGNWLLDYMLNRLDKIEKLRPLGNWLRPHFDELKSIPRYMIPSYFDVIVTGVYNALVEHSCQLMSPFVKSGSSLVKLLSLASLQFVSRCPNSRLPKVTANETTEWPTIAAGLTHFSTGYMRCWGRDTFIALPGLLLLTGRYQEAKQIILSFGTTMRHGLIPNLLDSGANPRYNCRDAVWWWVYCITKYAREAPNGTDILKEKISRIFPRDDSPAMKPGEHMQTLYETIQEALTVHFQGLSYRERNAGTQIDECMRDEGFNNKIGVDLETGFVYGGNYLNAGTWMDKMGSCHRSGNRGIPSTPRDGSAVELIGLLYASLRFMEEMATKKVIPCNSVERKNTDGSKTVWTYKEWADRIKQNFEKCFFVPHNGIPSPPANKRGIYKDSFKSSQEWADFQLRPNFPITMVVAPDLFNPQNAWEALEVTKKYLLGPLGMKTLDPEDWGYHGNYDNSLDCDDPKLSHGANYHQGPEWVWPIGYFLRARLHFGKLNNRLEETKAEIYSILTNHLHEIQSSHWRGLPELTNENGSYCRDSCRTQAWSISTVLEAVYDLKQS